MIFNVRNYGAAGDGSHNDTQAIHVAQMTVTPGAAARCFWRAVMCIAQER